MAAITTHGPLFGGGRAGPAYLAALSQRILPGVLSATSTNPNFPLANLADYAHPTRKWMATDITDTRLVIDLGDTLEIGAIFLGWFEPNGATDFTLQACDNGDWNDPNDLQLDWNRSIVDARIPLTRRYAYLLAPDPGTLAARFVSLFVPGHTGDPIGLAQFVVCDHAGLLIPQRPPLEYGADQRFTENEFPSGGREREVLGPKFLTFDFNWEYALDYLNPESTDVETTIVEDENIHADVDDHFLICRDVRHLPQYSAICRMNGGTIRISSPQGVGVSMPLGYSEIIA